MVLKNNNFDINYEDYDQIDEIFGFNYFSDFEKRLGWLLSYTTEKDVDENFITNLYFVDENGMNFKTKARYYPSCVIETKDNFYVEGYLQKRYSKSVHKIEIVERVDVGEYNHLCKETKKLLRIYLQNDISLKIFIRDMKEIIMENDNREFELCGEFKDVEDLEEIVQLIKKIHEYDIPHEIQSAINLGINSGKWFNVSYEGNDNYLYVPVEDLVKYPNLRIFAYDIETTKPPLKFPTPLKDTVMMISIMIESEGYLIINREVVSKDIENFEYSPKEEIKANFKIFNEENEIDTLKRFIELIQKISPHIITTFNGGMFDFKFIDVRLSNYNLSLEKLIGYKGENEYYNCPFMIHLDCYKWVKRDSYLPMSSQGLKAATRAKLGYEPEEVDPEEMCKFAIEDPERMAFYSVSDAVATYYLYIKYVHRHIFSMASIIPLSPVSILCYGSGTLCEALLISQAYQYKIIVKSAKKNTGPQFHKDDGYLINNVTYVGGHVESLKSGVFRAEFDHKFKNSEMIIKMIIDEFDQIFKDYKSSKSYNESKRDAINKLMNCVGDFNDKGLIYHLDVEAMYPNIILTNKLQPNAIVDESICVRCDFYSEKHKCQKKMKWVSKFESYPLKENDLKNFLTSLDNEIFYTYDKDQNEKRVLYENLPKKRQESIFNEKINNYCKQMFGKCKNKMQKVEESIICQREIPFYVETVRKFKNQRLEYKSLYKKFIKIAEADPTAENKERLNIYYSLQLAYKCVLNSFYGYVMRKGSRWFSLEMAAITCYTGSKIIQLAKEFIDGFSISLELDTDGIWAVIPQSFPSNITFDSEKVSFLAKILNYFVCKKFTNYQYKNSPNQQSKDSLLNKKEKEILDVSQNLISFDIDGPYKTMVIPSSTEENKLLKKRYAVFDFDNKIAELKGFEMKRRGELTFIKRFQEEIFQKFNDGKSLQECYDKLAVCCNYWLDIIYSKGENMDDETIFELFSEFKNMSKDLSEYANRKSNLVSAALKLAEILGNDILKDKLKTEYIVSKYPLDKSTSDRVLPILVFKAENKEIYLKKWIGVQKSYLVKDIIDWDYYLKRFQFILHRLIILPAHLQGIKNPLPKVEMLKWTNEFNPLIVKRKVKKVDIEDCTKKNISMFYSAKRVKSDIEFGENEYEERETNGLFETIDNFDKTIDESITENELFSFVNEHKKKWVNFYNKRINFIKDIFYIGTFSSTKMIKRSNLDQKKINSEINSFLISEDLIENEILVDESKITNNVKNIENRNKNILFEDKYSDKK